MEDYSADVKKIIAIVLALATLILLSVLPGIAKQSQENRQGMETNTVQVVPNSSGYLSISVSQGEIKQVTLINEKGQTLVSQRPRSASTLINTKNYKAGSYYVKVETDMQTVVKRFQKS
ncbi:MAG: T9SS type A sorting domain-containing protein [Prevotellaceae bacterium]|jgi:hypothetical protein|nr:T9SS type A sorting domain-containing protein [Prevotellaceae bacterium]